MSEIRIDHVTKKFDNAIAIKDLSFLCRDGEFVVVLGKPGAGKTTLLRMISGIDEPTSGEIYIGDTLVNGQPPEKRNVCMAFETYALYPHISVKQNMLSPLMSSNININ
jgi:ABC-type sugar transport system ATPase subunit